MLYLASISLLTAGMLPLDNRVDAIVQSEMRADKIPGVSLVVLQDGKPIKMRGYGMANLEQDAPVKPNTIFQSGSIGKQFTATLTMILAQEKVFSLDDPITRWFPEQQMSWNGVTIRHLLSHTSGLPDAPYDTMDMRKDYSEDDLVRLIASEPIEKAPGVEYRYNNGGYVLLGILIHRATGRFYGDLLKEKIFDPLGMSTARIISESDIVPHRAAGYELTDHGLKNQAWISPSLNTTADGSLYLSALDFAKWDLGLCSGKLLPDDDIQQAWTPARLLDGNKAGSNTYAYGFGWMIPFNNGGHQLVEHMGAWQGFSNYIGRVVDKKVTVVILTNLDSAHSKANEIGRSVLQQYVSDLPSLNSPL